MKIIVSHDVDHLYPSDHIFRDLIFPKLWVRSAIELIKGKISFKVFCFRIISVFSKKFNMIDELIKYNKDNGIPSIFFFGMNNALGMSYKKERAQKWIKLVIDSGLDAGVHGADFESFDNMKQEYVNFAELSGLSTFGIRMHYVRFDKKTFKKLANIGYLFDTTEFNKHDMEIKHPYKVGEMWEFPLHIMDGYVLKNIDLEESKQYTINAINKAEELKIPFFTVLFHDYLFNENTYPEYKNWYQWLIQYLKINNYEFTTYRNAIFEMEKQREDKINGTY